MKWILVISVLFVVCHMIYELLDPCNGGKSHSYYCTKANAESSQWTCEKCGKVV
jgi:hypothetical protein